MKMYDRDKFEEVEKKVLTRLNDILTVADVLGSDKFSYKASVHRNFSTDVRATIEVEIKRADKSNGRVEYTVDAQLHSHTDYTDGLDEHVVVLCSGYRDDYIFELGEIRMETELLQNEGIQSITIPKPSIDMTGRLFYLATFLDRVIAKPTRSHAIGCIVEQLKHLFYTSTYMALFTDKAKMPKYWWSYNTHTAGRFPVAYRQERVVIVPDVNNIFSQPIPHSNVDHFMVIHKDPNAAYFLKGHRRETMGSEFERPGESKTSTYIELSPSYLPEERMNTPECLGAMLYLTNEYSGYTLIEHR